MITDDDNKKDYLASSSATVVALAGSSTDSDAACDGGRTKNSYHEDVVEGARVLDENSRGTAAAPSSLSLPQKRKRGEGWENDG